MKRLGWCSDPGQDESSYRDKNNDIEKDGDTIARELAESSRHPLTMYRLSYDLVCR